MKFVFILALIFVSSLGFSEDTKVPSGYIKIRTINPDGNPAPAGIDFWYHSYIPKKGFGCDQLHNLCVYTRPEKWVQSYLGQTNSSGEFYMPRPTGKVLVKLVFDQGHQYEDQNKKALFLQPAPGNEGLFSWTLENLSRDCSGNEYITTTPKDIANLPSELTFVVRDSSDPCY